MTITIIQLLQAQIGKIWWEALAKILRRANK